MYLAEIGFGNSLKERKGGESMKIYKKGSAAYSRQKKTQKDQAAAAARPKKPLDQHGRKYLHPERHK